ncbi:MAG: hypothetical protein R3276_11565, partial [Marinobacter sp.]|nr:hypothetical protein [Marinobacter sp.]
DQFLKQGVVLCEHLADQIMLPLLVAGGGRFSCPPLSLHAASNANLIRSLTGHHFSVHENGDQWVLGLGG